MEGTIMRSEVMAEINSGRPFDCLEFVTADRRRGTGGKLIITRKWRRLFQDMPLENLPGYIKKKFERMLSTRQGNRKDFVIFNPGLPAQHPITVHYWLMVSFNGKRIING
jgi:hypothetical protein